LLLCIRIVIVVGGLLIVVVVVVVGLSGRGVGLLLRLLVALICSICIASLRLTVVVTSCVVLCRLCVCFRRRLGRLGFVLAAHKLVVVVSVIILVRAVNLFVLLFVLLQVVVRHI
jgi:hypothetical protein